MKLSEKGFHKVLRTCRFDEDRATYVLKYSEAIKDYFFEVQGTEFESDDFTGAVILTAEEANLLFSVIDGFFDLRLPTTKEIVALNKLKVRVERIAKAESEK